jgi:hypothetical protein
MNQSIGKNKKIRNLFKNNFITFFFSYGNTPLLYSIDRRKLLSFKIILNDLNADPDKINEITKESPFHLLCKCVNVNYKQKDLELKRKYGIVDKNSLEERRKTIHIEMENIEKTARSMSIDGVSTIDSRRTNSDESIILNPKKLPPRSVNKI